MISCVFGNIGSPVLGAGVSWVHAAVVGAVLAQGDVTALAGGGVLIANTHIATSEIIWSALIVVHTGNFTVRGVSLVGEGVGRTGSVAWL